MDPEQLLQMVEQKMEQSNQALLVQVQELMKQAFSTFGAAANQPGMAPLPPQQQGNEHGPSGANHVPGPASVDLDDQPPDNTPELQWSTVLQSNKATLQTPIGQQIGQMLAAPPPLQQLKHTQQAIRLYSGVPETPLPTKAPADKWHFDAQVKVEAAMHLMLRSLEEDDKDHVVQAFAWLRSSWEDQLQTRRRSFAGHQSWKLDPRKDDNKPRLVTIEEEKKLQQGKSKGKGKGPPSTTPRTWNGDKTSSNSRSWGRGKGKSRSSSSSSKTDQQ